SSDSFRNEAAIPYIGMIAARAVKSRLDEAAGPARYFGLLKTGGSYSTLWVRNAGSVELENVKIVLTGRPSWRLSSVSGSESGTIPEIAIGTMAAKSELLVEFWGTTNLSRPIRIVHKGGVGEIESFTPVSSNSKWYHFLPDFITHFFFACFISALLIGVLYVGVSLYHSVFSSKPNGESESPSTIQKSGKPLISDKGAELESENRRRPSGDHDLG
ncbi:MAG: hypothetical protein WA771_13200, partial [Chthoniobacterales bacterium]